MAVAELSFDEPARALKRVTDVSALFTVLRFGLDPIGEMGRIRARHGALTEFSFYQSGKTRRYVLAVGSRYNKRVLSDPATFQSVGIMLPGPRQSAQRRISRGLLGPPGPNHAHYRRMMLAPLRRAAVDRMAAKISHIVEQEASGWPQGAPIDLFGLCKSVTQRAAVESLFPNGSGGFGQEVLDAVKLIDEHLEMAASPVASALQLNIPGLPYHRMVRHAEAVETALVAWARKWSKPARDDDLMCLLANNPDEAGASPGETAVLNHLPSLFGAAYETCQTALVWALFLLAQHPNAAARLHEELQALPDDGPEHLLECAWLDGIVRESMRMLPSVPTQTRRANRNADLVDCDVEAGAYVVLSAFLTNREPDVFPEPARFRPERWASLDLNQYEYLAFRAGPRTCIGNSFAANFLRIAVGQIVRRYRLEVVANARIDHKVRVMLKPGRGGIPVIVHPQDGRPTASPIKGSIRDIVEFQ